MSGVHSESALTFEALNLAERGLAHIPLALNNLKIDSTDYLFGAYDSLTGAIIDSMPLIEDLGDTVPFLYLINLKGLAEKEVAYANNLLKKNPLYINDRNKRIGSGFVYGYDWTDLILGLLEWHVLTQDKKTFDTAEALIREWKKRFIAGGRAWGVSHIKLGLPMPIASLNDVGMFPELLIRWSELGGDAKDVILAKEIVDTWIDLGSFKRTGLFPRLSVEMSCGKWLAPLFEWVLFKTRPNILRSILFKDNTNFAFSILSVYEKTNTPKYIAAFDHWMNSCIRHLQDSGGGFWEWWHGRDLSVGRLCATNFQMIDVAIEAYLITSNDKYLNIAKEVADFWISKQTNLGLFPQWLEGKRSNLSASDTQTDMGVALVKLAAATGDDRYLQAAIRVGNGILNYHYRDFGMLNWVNASTGVVVDATSKTKFLILSSKLWIALKNCRTVVHDKNLYKILGDR